MKLLGEVKPVCILTYQNDKLNGECIRIDDKGCQLKCTLKDDILNGPFSSYDENDTLLATVLTTLFVVETIKDIPRKW